MKINTKLNVNDNAYVMLFNRVHKVVIEEILITISIDTIKIIYIIELTKALGQDNSRYYEVEIFATKQQLLDSL